MNTKHLNTRQVKGYSSDVSVIQMFFIQITTVHNFQSRVNTLESLKEKTDSELNRLLLQAPRLTTSQRHEDLRRLSKALQVTDKTG